MRGRGRQASACRGFTLLEMLVALGVFAVIGVMSAQLVRQIADIGATTRQRGDELVALQRALDIMGRDVEQLAHRPVRGEMGDAGAAVAVNHSALLEFTRRGWRNPSQARRPALQRVAYRVTAEGLERLFWPVLDRAEDSQPVAQLLLAGVSDVDVSGIDDSGEEHGYWPPADATRQLAALVVRVSLPRHGEIERLWVVPWVAPPQSDEDDAGAAEDDDDPDADDGADEPADERAPTDVDRLA